LYKKQQHELLAQRGLILMKQKEYKSAINDFKKAYEAYPINNYLLQLAKCYLLAGNGKKSYDYAVQYLKKENYNFEAIKIASLSGYQSKNYDEALTYAMKFLTYIPNDTLYGLAGDIFMKQQDYISALKNYSLAIKLNPYCTEYYSHRGTIYFTTQNYVVADMDYTLYLDYFPKDGDILYKRGLCRYYSNQTSRACADWKNATKVNQMEAAKMYNKYCK
jgi:tetratricopeptide (TPR) repeat protein